MHYLCGVEIEKFLPQDHHLLSLDKPGDSCRKFFHPTLTLVIDSIVINIIRGHMLEFPNYIMFLSMKICFIIIYLWQ